MGATGTGTGAREAVVLDAGALIGAERGTRTATRIIDEATELDIDLVIPTTALAQVWRGGPRAARLAHLIKGCAIDSLDEPRAKEVGVRLGLRDGSDVADAHVVCCAVEQRGTIATSDPDDVEALVEPDESLTLIAV